MALIVAEIGQNFCGIMDMARKMIREAKKNGADLVKFQLYDSVKLYGEKQKSELSFDQALELFEYGKKRDMEVFFSVFDIERVKWCEEIGVKRYKIACDAFKENAQWVVDEQCWSVADFISMIIGTGKPCFISHNGIGIPTIAGNISWLYCVPDYPTNIARIDFGDMEECEGLSDHTIGLDAAKIALSRGAKIIEKHFTLYHDMGVDGEWSMTPDELKELKRFEMVVNEAL